MKPISLLIGTSTLLAAGAFAELPESNGVPVMEFHTIPLEVVGNAEHKVMPYRLYDKVVVTVWDPVNCGQRASNASFSIEGATLMLTYQLSEAKSSGKKCTLVSEFDISHFPHKDVEVRFAGGHEAYSVAKMQKCPFYEAKSDDIYECLSPSKK